MGMDNLAVSYKAWTDQNKNATEYQAYQAGYTAGAVSMRARALAIVQEQTRKPENVDLNGLINAIGQLPDVTT